MNFNKIVSKLGVIIVEVKNKYCFYDLVFECIKLIVDELVKIVKDIEKMLVDMEKLMLIEKWVVV